MARKNNVSIVDFFDSESPEITEFRRVLRNIDNAGKEEPKKTILVTSAMLSEGKSLLSAFLAMTSAKARKKKTLLIDFDLRRPMAHKLFAIDLENGVSDILFTGVAPRTIAKKTGLENLDIITAGEIVANPSELFNGTTIHDLFEELKFYYDLILVDSPPMIPVMDPMILLEELDGMVMVLKAGETNRDVVRRARDLLTNQKDKVVGVIVNNLNHTLPHYYNYNYYGYHYKTADVSKKPKTVDLSQANNNNKTDAPEVVKKSAKSANK